jgi:glycosyltransferase involved in cell wall biosynthesis
MQIDLVSVIIPTYNRAHQIIAAIESALNQTYQEVEVLVIDDGSMDATQETVTKKYSGNSRVRYFRKQNAGVSSARNLGLREAQGEFIAFLDSDDLWLPEKIELQLEALKLFPDAIMVWTDMNAIDTAGNVIHEKYLRKMYHAYRFFSKTEDLFSQNRLLNSRPLPCYYGHIFSAMAIGNLVHTSTVLFKAGVRKGEGYFNESYKTGEDYPFHLKTSSLGPCVFIDATLTLYRVGADDALTSNKYLLEASQNFLNTIQRTLTEKKGQIQLPKKILRQGLADAHLWVAAQQLEAGNRLEGLNHNLRSLFILPQAVSLKLLLKILAPQPAIDFLKRLIGK